VASLRTLFLAKNSVSFHSLFIVGNYLVISLILKKVTIAIYVTARYDWTRREVTKTLGTNQARAFLFDHLFRHDFHLSYIYHETPLTTISIVYEFNRYEE